ncbi:MAG: hypothetical protein ACFFDN_26500, partial [Candidatus Hodarchaeota archaeon]
MNIKFLYLDDEEKERINSLVRELDNKELGLEIVFRNPKEYSEQVNELVKELIHSNFNGLILDWRLDLLPVMEGRTVQYRASSIAQEIRTRASEKDILEVPIVLLSASDKLRQSYDRDESSHDIFDKIYIKEAVADNAKQISTELITLVEGYRRISYARKKKYPFYKILKLEKKYQDTLDLRLQEIFPEEELKPSHKYAQFIIKEMIEVPGPLIDEFILAARLGIDIEKSNDWETLKVNAFDSFSYKGPFSKAWSRWWSILLEKWWETLKGGSEPLPFLNSSERIEILKENTNCRKLFPAKVIDKGYSSKFW